jgi:anthranilate synthase/phosphoribosyltransferase
MILLIDNYDSFTYNLKQYLEELTQKVRVVRNDAITIDGIEKMKPSHIVISPGPGRPETAGISVEVIRRLSGRIPILGVCLGHQAIGYAFGGKVIPARTLMHGKVSSIEHGGKGIFRDIPDGFEATRYHSLAVERESLPDDLEVTAQCGDGEIMGLRHRNHLTEGVQFHPESILTTQGRNLLKNFLEYTYEKKAEGLLIRDSISRLIEGKDLETSAATAVMNEIMEGNSTPAQIASFLTALRLKGETVEEITAFASVMRDKAVKIRPVSQELIDTCGTGGDGAGTFNISTTAAFVAAGAGIRVAKHGNRSVSSNSGSADVLEALNVSLDLAPEEVTRCVDTVGMGFLFAPKLHPAMKYAIGPRREMGIRTVFNILGPLTNPASARFQIMGVYSQSIVKTLAEVLKNLGIVRGYVVSSDDGLDEISISSPTFIAEIRDGSLRTFTFKPEDAGYERARREDVAGGGPMENALITMDILKGKRGPRRDIVCLNAGFAIAAVDNITVREGIARAEESIDSGAAMKKLEDLKDFTNSV